MIFMCIVSLIVSKTIIYRLPQQCFIFNKYLINWKNLVRQKIKKCFANCNGKITMGEKKRENRKTFLDELIILFVLYIAQIILVYEENVIKWKLLWKSILMNMFPCFIVNCFLLLFISFTWWRSDIIMWFFIYNLFWITERRNIIIRWSIREIFKNCF